MIQEYYGETILHIAIINRNASMIEWLLGDENNEPLRQQQLKATATGNFFKMYVLISAYLSELL